MLPYPAAHEKKVNFFKFMNYFQTPTGYSEKVPKKSNVHPNFSSEKYMHGFFFKGFLDSSEHFSHDLLYFKRMSPYSQVKPITFVIYYRICTIWIG